MRMAIHRQPLSQLVANSLLNASRRSLLRGNRALSEPRAETTNRSIASDTSAQLTAEQEDEREQEAKPSVASKPKKQTPKFLEIKGLETVLKETRSPWDLFLGLDVSTKSTGFALIDSEGSIVRLGRVELGRQSSLLDVSFALQRHLRELRKETEGKSVKPVVESFMPSFAQGRTTNKTLFTLAQLNGIVTFQCAEIFSTVPSHCSPLSVRKFFNIKGKTRAIVKKEVFDFVERLKGKESLTRLEIVDGQGKKQTKLLSEWELSRNGKLSVNNYDISDACIIGLYGAYTAKIPALLANEEVALRFEKDCLETNTRGLQHLRRKVTKLEGAEVGEAAMQQHINQYVTEKYRESIELGLARHAQERTYRKEAVE